VLAGKGAKRDNSNGNRTNEEDGAERPKPLSTQAAMHPQSFTGLSEGIEPSGQQSCMSSEADMSPESDTTCGADMALMSIDFSGNAAPPAIGSIATENATMRDNMVRAMFIAANCTAISYLVTEGSSDDFASNLTESGACRGAPDHDTSRVEVI
jgi:hypothetical protein